MIASTIYALLSVILVSLISVLVAIPLFFQKKVSKGILVFLLSVSVGVLLSTVFLDFLPEIFAHDYDLSDAFGILLGFISLFVLEKFVHWHHNNKCADDDHGHGHAYHLAPINLIGDGVHNFIDGLVIAGSYAVNITVGMAATVSIIFHEIPQEIADFGVLIYSGMSKKKAILFNFISAVTAIIGAVIGLLLAGTHNGFLEFIIPFAAGNFIYIAASNLVPQLHRHCKLKETFVHILAILIGIVMIYLVTVIGPAHAHG